MNKETGTHNPHISAFKGICIILMVFCHSGYWGFFRDVIYNFHMPAFLFIGGYLLSDRYVAGSWIHFFRKKGGALWVPYVFWSLLFLAAAPLLEHFRLIDSEAVGSEGLPVRMAKIFTMTGTLELLGGFWFLKEMLGGFLIAVALLKITKGRYSAPLRVAVTLLLMPAAYYMWRWPAWMPPIHILWFNMMTVEAAFFVLAGYLFRRSRWNSRQNPFAAAVCVVVLVTVSLFFAGSIGTGGSVVFIYMPLALVGSIGVLNLATSVLHGRALSFLDRVGVHSLNILIFHFLSMKVVSLAVILISGLGIERLAEFPVLYDTDCRLVILYTLAGVGLPMAGAYLVTWVRRSFLTTRPAAAASAQESD